MAGARNEALNRPERPSVHTPPVTAARQQAERADVRHRDLDSRLTDYRQRRGPSVGDPGTPRVGFSGDHRGGDYRGGSYRGGDRDRGLSSHRPTYVHARYYDRPDLIRHDYHHAYTYYDSHFRLHHRVIWPYYHYPIYYRFGPHVHFDYVYPYYHRKYVFISLGGYWPDDYFYMRYYWYGYHPYVWYGYYPVAREVAGDNYNYYTYNYYYQNTDGSYTSQIPDTTSDTELQAVDQSTWTDVRQKLDEQQAKEPAAQTLADTRFEEGVKSFETGNYDAAAGKFDEAIRLSPGDMILPFAYAQALFAGGKYDESADMLRRALSHVTPEKEGVFYPRGLYANDDVLYAQIEKLVDKMEASDTDNDANLQLLLGYHLLGTGETGYARDTLEQAAQDPTNETSAKILLRMADKIESEAKTDETQTDGAAEKSSVAPQSQAPVKTEAAPSSDTQATLGGGQSLVAPSAAPAPSDSSVQPQKESQTPDVNGTSPATEQKDPNAAAIVPSSDAGSSDGLEMAEASAGLSLQAIAGLGRYLRADVGVFAGMVLLGSAGLYIQWKLPSRGRV